MKAQLKPYRILVICLFIGISIKSLNAQSWTYRAGGDTIDGIYKTSMVVGMSKDSSFHEPIFVINVLRRDVENPTIYLTDVPVLLCTNDKILISFDTDPKIFTFSVLSDEKKVSWFLHLMGGKSKNQSISYGNVEKSEDDEYQESKRENELKYFIMSVQSRSSKMYVRLRSSCLKYECSFSLSGSREALDFVFENK